MLRISNVGVDDVPCITKLDVGVEEPIPTRPEDVIVILVCVVVETPPVKNAILPVVEAFAIYKSLPAPMSVTSDL